MKILGLSCGRKMGNSEVLLREALMAAEELGAEVEIIRFHDLNIKPCTGCETCMARLMKGTGGYEYECVIKNDDMPFLLNKLWEADGQIVSAPIFSYNPPGFFRLVLDRLHSAGRRRLKPMPGAVICVGGSDWVNLALALTGAWVTRTGGKLVDQMLVPFTARPAQVLLNEEAMARAHRLGRTMGEAIKTPFDQVKYVGQGMKVSEAEMMFYARAMDLPFDWVKYVIEEEETCPLCHTNLLQVRGKFVRCPLCEMKGTLEMKGDKLQIRYDDEEIQNRRGEPSESQKHFHIIQASHQIHEDRKHEIQEKLKKYRTKSVTVPPR
jgi:multimeric flavodoxin WrbA